MSLQPPPYDFEELGPLPDELNPLSELYEPQRYDSEFRPLSGVDERWASSRSPSPSLSSPLMEVMPSTSTQHMQQQQLPQSSTFLLTNSAGSDFDGAVLYADTPVTAPLEQAESALQMTSSDSSAIVAAVPDNQPADSSLVDPMLSIDLAELDRYLNTTDSANISPGAVVPSTFDAIINEDHLDDALAVRLDHPYHTLTSSMSNDNSLQLDASILDEYLTPLPSTSTMTNGNADADNFSPTYLETFTNLEPYLQHKQGSSTPPECVQSSEHVMPSHSMYSVEGMRMDALSPTSEDFSSQSVETRLETPSDYRRRRDKNNVASQMSRRKRQDKFRAMKEEEVQLKKRNTELHAAVSDLERQVNNLKEIMMKAVTS